MNTRGVSCEDLVELLLDVKAPDVRTYRALLDTEAGSRVDEVADALDRNRSTAYRSLERLVRCDLAVKEKRTDSGRTKGGYFYVYRPVTPRNVRETVERCLEEWYRETRSAVERLDEGECLAE